MRKGTSAPLDDQLRQLGSVRFRLGPGARSRIRAAFREQSSIRRGTMGWQMGVPALSIAAAGMALLVLSAGFLARFPQTTPIVTNNSVVPAETVSGPEGLWMDYKDGRVVLTWNDASPRYLSHASTMPVARTAEAIPVRAGVFVEEALPEPGQAVFYVVQ